MIFARPIAKNRPTGRLHVSLVIAHRFHGMTAAGIGPNGPSPSLPPLLFPERRRNRIRLPLSLTRSVPRPAHSAGPYPNRETDRHPCRYGRRDTRGMTIRGRIMKNVDSNRPEGSRPLLPSRPESGRSLLLYWVLGGNHRKTIAPGGSGVKEE
jgi:hypothetical protein